MHRGISFKRLFEDSHVLKIRASASNGDFCGVADIYESPGTLEHMGSSLQGFPTETKDRRTVSLGTFDRDSAGGGLTMLFFCPDSTGRITVEVQLQSQDLETNQRQTASFSISTEPSAIDSFVEELNQFGAKSIANLEAAEARTV